MKIRILAVILLLLTLSRAQGTYASAKRPADIVSLRSAAPNIKLDIRYFSTKNFIGKRLDGYEAPECLLSSAAVARLKKAQESLNAFGLSLLVYDCYRPQRTVNQFVAWAKRLDDTKMKAQFYPNVPKERLFLDGYVAEKSGHSRTSTVDLTIEGLDMGTPFDFFDPLSHTIQAKLDLQVRANRALLSRVMEGAGFKNLPEEWWHFTLKDEPYPDQYFDFPVR